MIYFVLISIIGFICGGLVNLFSDYLPERYNLKRGDKKIELFVCSRCNNEIQTLEYLGLQRCHHCRRYPRFRVVFVNLLFAIVFYLLFLFTGGKYSFLEMSVLAILFGIICVIDIEHKVILDVVSYTGAIIGLIIGLAHHGILSTIIGGGAGFGVMFLFHHLGNLYTGWVSKRRHQEIDEVALGGGDVKLAGVLGMLLGWPGIILGLFFGIFAGGLTSLIIMLIAIARKKYSPTMAIPYAPFLVLGTMILLIWH